MKSEHLHEESKTKQQGVEGQNISTDALKFMRSMI